MGVSVFHSRYVRDWFVPYRTSRFVIDRRIIVRPNKFYRNIFYIFYGGVDVYSFSSGVALLNNLLLYVRNVTDISHLL